MKTIEKKNVFFYKRDPNTAAMFLLVSALYTVLIGSMVYSLCTHGVKNEDDNILDLLHCPAFHQKPALSGDSESEDEVEAEVKNENENEDEEDADDEEDDDEDKEDDIRGHQESEPEDSCDADDST